MTADFRSDTITRPTPAMYEAMAKAELGDDVLGDDPTVTRLEEKTAELVGHEAALFVPSGTMGNQIAVATHTRPGDAMLIEQDAHILYYEVGAPAVLSSVVSWTLPSNKGIMDPAVIESRVLTRNLHTPGTTLLCVENSHNRAGGTVHPLSVLGQYREIAHRHKMNLHMDGARVWNAAVALGVPVKEVTSLVDSVSVCLSKGLCAPVGSVLCGKADFIEEARIWRKRLGGGMRQAGLLAACGLVSLTMIDRLAEDHQRARRLAEKLEERVPGSIDLDGIQTNIVLVQTKRPAAELQAELGAVGVHFFPVAPHRFRLVFHHDLTDEGIDYALEQIAPRLA